MSNIFQLIGNFLVTLWLRLTLPSAPVAPVPVTPPVGPTPATPTPAPAVNLPVTLQQLILSFTEDAGPFPGTGGRIYAVDADEALTVANLIIKYAAQYKLNVSLVASYVRQESAASPLAFNPNNQDAKPGETAAEAFSHADIGIAQLDGATLLGMTENKGLTVEQIEAKAYDPNWSLNIMCGIIASDNAAISAAMSPALFKAVPNGDVRIAQANAYNAGVHGTLESLASPQPNLAYGQQVVSRADGWASLLDVA